MAHELGRLEHNDVERTRALMILDKFGHSDIELA